MRAIAALLVMVASLILAGCAVTEMEAEITITSIDQADHGGGSWGLVFVYFNVTNTGTEDIVACEIWFEIQSVDTSLFYGYAIAPGTPQGVTVSGLTIIDTAGKQVSSARITAQALH